MDEDEAAKEKKQLEWQNRMESDVYLCLTENMPKRLEEIIAEGCDPNLVFSGLDAMGRPLCWYPLHICCEKGRYECAQVLLRAGADPDVGDRWCVTPLMYAVRHEWHNMVELMLESGATVDLQDSKGRTPLHFAVECSDTKCIEILLKANAETNIIDLVGRIPLWCAVTQDGRVNHVKEIIHLSYINLPDSRDNRTPLQEAILYPDVDRVEYVRMLLAAGSEVNHRDEANLNSILNLMYRCRRKNKGVMEDDLEIAKALLDAGYELNDVPVRKQWHKYGGTAIKMAAEMGATELVELFLERGANPDLGDDCRVTPLLAAAYNAHYDCVVSLLNANCALNPVGELKIKHVYHQLTPLHCAIISGHLQVARLLVQAGTSIASESYLFDGNDVPEALVLNCKDWQWFIAQATNPLSLFDLCVRRIRESMGLGLRGKLEKVGLPGALKRCVLLEELLGTKSED